MISEDALLKIMKNTFEVMKANEKYLTKLDADIGDADHGINMARGFNTVNDRLSQLTNPDAGEILNTTGMTLLETIGGAAGPLYGMLFMKAHTHVAKKTKIDKRDLANLWEAGLKAVQEIGGGAVPGEKTMVDVLDPVVRALKRSADDESITLMMALEEVKKVAKESAHKTIPLLAKRGRASYLEERSIGHQDPGATSTYLILRTILDTLNGYVGVKVVGYNESNGAILKEEYIRYTADVRTQTKSGRQV